MLLTKTLSLTDSYQTLYTCPTAQEASLHGLLINNLGATDEWVSLGIYISLTDTWKFYGRLMAAGEIYAWPKPINLQDGDAVSIKSQDVGTTVNVAASIYSTTDVDVQVAVGFNLMGVYAAGTTYNTNDVVSYVSGTSTKSGAYASRTDGNVGHTPDTNPTFWQQLSIPLATVTTAQITDYITDQATRSAADIAKAIAFAVAL